MPAVAGKNSLKAELPTEQDEETDLTDCIHCGRSFKNDVLNKHQAIC